MDSNSDSGCVATGLSFNLNLHPPPADQKRLSHDDDDDDDDNGVDQHMENLDAGVLDQQIKNQEVQGGNSNLMEAITRIDRESKRMADMVANMVDKCSTMHQQLMDLIINSNHQLINNHGEDDQRANNPHLKRKSDHVDHDHNDADNSPLNNNNNNYHVSELSCVSDGNCCKRIRLINCKPKITTSFIRVDPSDTSLAVKDGYQWRKYGQKVTRDNPSPRAYFKCSFAPICPVKKKVQKSVEDPTVLVATYEGEHNHKQPPSVGSLNITPCSTISIPAASTLINVVSPSSNYLSSPSSSSPLDRFIHQNHSDSNCNHNKERAGSDEEGHDNEDVPRSPLQHWIIQQMASSLTKDPSFTSTLAAAISDKVLEHSF